MNSSVLLFLLLCKSAYSATVPFHLFGLDEARWPLVLPKSNVPCLPSDDDFSKCIREKFRIIIPQLNRFINRDPITLPYIEHAYQHGPMHGAVQLRNLNLYGLNQTEFVDADVLLSNSKKNLHARIDLYIPSLRLEAFYKNDFNYVFNVTNGHLPEELEQLNGTDVHQDGVFGVTINNINVTHYWFGHETPEGILQLNALNLDVEVDEMVFNFSGLYPDKNRNDMAVSTLNKNWRIFFNLYLPRFLAMNEPRMTRLINMFMSSTRFTSIIAKPDDDNNINV